MSSACGLWWPGLCTNINYKFFLTQKNFCKKMCKKNQVHVYNYLLQLCRELILVKKGIVIPCYDPKVTVDEGNDRMYIRPEGVDPKVVWENMISGCNQELLNKYDNSYLMWSHIYTGYMYVLLIMIYWMYEHQHINFLFYFWHCLWMCCLFPVIG